MWNEILDTTYQNQSGKIQNSVNLNPVQIEALVEMEGDITRQVLHQEAREGNVDQLVSLFHGKNETSASHPLAERIKDLLLERVGADGDIPLAKAEAAHRMIVPYILTLIKDRLSGDGTVPNSQSLNTIFGGSGTLSEGQEDKVRREWAKKY